MVPPTDSSDPSTRAERRRRLRSLLGVGILVIAAFASLWLLHNTLTTTLIVMVVTAIILRLVFDHLLPQIPVTDELRETTATRADVRESRPGTSVNTATSPPDAARKRRIRHTK